MERDPLAAATPELWHADPAGAAAAAWAPVWRGWLAPAEAARAAAMAPAAAARYRAGRGMLRWVLARHLGMAPGAVPLAAPAGAPRLEGIGLSVAHTRGRVVVLVAPGSAAVGVDVEAWDRPVDGVALVGRLVGADAAAELAAVAEGDPAAARRRALAAWLAAEAAVKARGGTVGAALRAVWPEPAAAAWLGTVAQRFGVAAVGLAGEPMVQELPPAPPAPLDLDSPA